MRVQIIEPMSGGHHTNYVRDLIPAGRKLLEAGVLSEIVISVTPTLASQLTAIDAIPPDARGIRLDPSLTEVSPGPSLLERRTMYLGRHQAMVRERADAVLYTTADYDVMVDAAYRQVLRRRSPRGTRVIGVMHYNLPTQKDDTFREKVKRAIYDAAWAGVDWDRLLLVNPLVYESMRASGRGGSRLSMLPDPVPRALPLSRAQARAVLGIPTDGRYIGFVGMMDARKAIPELARGFAAAKFGSDVRLLLAGQINDDYVRYVRELMPQQVASGQIVILAERLDERRLMAGYAALDVHALLQYRRVNLSANTLKAAATGAPVVADDYGHQAMVIRRFGAGVVCNMHDPQSVAAALHKALALDHPPDPLLAQLMRFHSMENFARVAYTEACGQRAAEVLGEPVRWEAVFQPAVSDSAPSTRAGVSG